MCIAAEILVLMVMAAAFFGKLVVQRLVNEGVRDLCVDALQRPCFQVSDASQFIESDMTNLKVVCRLFSTCIRDLFQ